MPPAQVALKVEVLGDREVVATIRRLRVETVTMVQKAISKAAIAIDRGAKRRVAVDTGRLRSSIRPYFKAGRGGLYAATVGTNVKYAPFIEFGTSVVGSRTNKQPLPEGYVHGTRHKPIPVEALIPWARRHGMDEEDAGGVAFAIASRPGLPARPFLFPAFEEERPKLLKSIREIVFRQAPRRARGGL